MKFVKPLLLITAFFLVLTFPKQVGASDGTVELISTTNKDYRCFAASLLMQNNSYTIVTSCRDLLYPGDEKVINYVVWVNPKEGGAPIRLGVLGYGKAQYNTKTPFSSMFVSVEENPNVKEPSGTIVMRGNVKPIGIFETTPTKTPENTQEGQDTTTTQTQTEKPSTRDRIVTGLKRAGIASVFALVAVLGLVFILTRPR